MDLSVIWACIIVLGVMIYVVLDGLDLGVGVLFPFARNADDRGMMIDSLAPFWDGNETWLILGGAGLLAAFPAVYAIVLPAFYLPLMLMLFALIFRGVAFEFRGIADKHRYLWDIAFSGGSITAAFAQGLTLGGLIHGIKVEGVNFAGGSWDWLSPFSLMTGLAVVAAYGLLGATWLILKSEGGLQAWARVQSRALLLIVIGFVVVVSLWTPWIKPQVFDRWFTLTNMFLLAPVPLLTAAAAGLLWRSIDGPRELLPLGLTVVLFVLGFLGLGISLWPYAVPFPGEGGLTIWDVAAPRESQAVTLVGVCVLVPIIIGYTAHNYWVFRGKVSGGYHH